MHDSNDDAISEKRWVMFHIRPDDLFALLRIMPESDAQFFAPHFPPDNRIQGAFFHGERDTFVIVLESEFFDPISVTYQHGKWAGAWNEMLFSMEQANSLDDINEDEMWTAPIDPASVREPIEPRALPQLTPNNAPYTRWALFWIKPDDIIRIFQMMARKIAIRIPAMPQDAKLVYAIYDGGRNAFGLFVSSEDFDPIQARIAEDGSTMIQCSENFLTVTLE